MSRKLYELALEIQGRLDGSFASAMKSAQGDIKTLEAETKAWQDRQKKVGGTDAAYIRAREGARKLGGELAGRLEMCYRYSKDIVYNNFPWPAPSDEQRAKIEQTAQSILDVRALYSESSLVGLYGYLTMPEPLLKAHRANDAAVCAAYGFERNIEEAEIVAKLMGLYEGLTQRKGELNKS